MVVAALPVATNSPPGLPQPWASLSPAPRCWFLSLDVSCPALTQEAEACRMAEGGVQKSCPPTTSLYQGPRGLLCLVPQPLTRTPNTARQPSLVG